MRHVAMPGRTIRQQLLAHSDRERSRARAGAQLRRVTPVAETGQSFVDWRTSFDCAPEERKRWLEQFEQKGFAVWLAALRDFMRVQTESSYAASSA